MTALTLMPHNEMTRCLSHPTNEQSLRWKTKDPDEQLLEKQILKNNEKFKHPFVSLVLQQKF